MNSRRHEAPDTALWRRLLALCREAGEAISALYARPGEAGRLRDKADDSPLTQADLASHRILRDGLQALTPELPLLSEESDPAAIADRHDWSTFWMVDPLDGTREFLARTGEFTINLALIHQQRAIAGLIYEPLAQRASYGAPGQGAICGVWEAGGWKERKLGTRALPDRELVLLASRRHRNARLELTRSFLDSRYEVTRSNSGSALKFCDLAAGRGDCYPRFTPCSEWDVAAGDALVSAAGGAVLGLDGRPLRYNARDTLLAEPFLAVGDPRRPLWGELLAALGSGETP
jgi:3'(2'), 5'-bisphosphate nucleotidase